jgi:hypothetical protein
MSAAEQSNVTSCEIKNFAGFVFSHHFGAYRLRLTVESDRDHCARWIEQDDDHRGMVLPEFFIRQTPGVECWVLEFATSCEPIFYFRMSRALRLDIQFGPVTTAEEKEELMAALMEGFGWLIATSAKSGYRQIVFDSKNPALIRFCDKRFGFKKSPNELVCSMAAPVLVQPTKESVPQEQQ